VTYLVPKCHVPFKVCAQLWTAFFIFRSRLIVTGLARVYSVLIVVRNIPDSHHTRSPAKNSSKPLERPFRPWLPSVVNRQRYSDWLRAGRPSGRSSSPSRVKNFLFSTSSRPALRPTQPSVQWVPRALSPGVKQQRREADPTHLRLVPKSRIRGSIPPLPHTSSWRSA
jgi:hypothetical protein